MGPSNFCLSWIRSKNNVSTVFCLFLFYIFKTTKNLNYQKNFQNTKSKKYEKDCAIIFHFAFLLYQTLLFFMIYAILLDTISKTTIYYTTTTLLQSTDGCERSPAERVLLACGEGLLLNIIIHVCVLLEGCLYLRPILQFRC